LGIARKFCSRAGLTLTDKWALRAMARRDLNLDAMVFAGGGITYQNDCFTLDTAFSRTYVRDRDIEPDNTISVRVGLKNLTEL
jgi:Organic solvent tolerance protein OstA